MSTLEERFRENFEKSSVWEDAENNKNSMAHELLKFTESEKKLSKKEEKLLLDNEISKLLHDFAATPLSMRETGWHWLLKLRNNIYRNHD